MATVTREPVETLTLHGGEQRLYTFGNGYGASVVMHTHSYGGSSGLYELAVLDTEGNLTYETEITSDVIGWLSETEVQEILARIDAL